MAACCVFDERFGFDLLCKMICRIYVNVAQPSVAYSMIHASDFRAKWFDKGAKLLLKLYLHHSKIKSEL